MTLVRRIYLCGGGTNTFCHLGALEVLAEYGYLKAICEWMGTSAGALYAMSLAIGYSLAEFREFVLRFNFENLMDPDTASGWIDRMGFDTGLRWHRLLNALLKEKGFAETLTFEELFQRKRIHLRVFATNLSTGVLKEFSDRLTPTYSIVHAVRASIALPYYYQPFECPITKDLYIDGGVVSNYPLNCLSETDRAETLGIQVNYIIHPLQTVGLEDMISRPLNMLLQQRAANDYMAYREQTLYIMMDSKTIVEFDMSADKKRAIMDVGARAATHFVKGFRKPVRRYSVA